MSQTERMQKGGFSRARGVARGLKESGRLREELARKLGRTVQGEVRFDNGSRALYATDSSNYRQTPIGVVIPRDKGDVIETLRLCREYGVPITSRGGGTSLAGQCCNTAVILDFSKYMNKLLEIDEKKKLARVQPGLVLDHLRVPAQKLGLTFGSDTSTHAWCTMGGVLGNNSCGVHSVLGQFLGNGPRTSDNTCELDILTYDGLRMRVGETTKSELEGIIGQGGRRGEIYARLRQLRDRYAELIRAKYPQIPRRVSGYNLDDLLPEKGFQVARSLVGTEGTCVTILEATLHLIPWPRARVLTVLGFPDVYTACDHVPEVMSHKPTGLEGIDDVLLEAMKTKAMHQNKVHLLPEGRGWLLVELGGEEMEEAEAKAEKLIKDLKKRKVLIGAAVFREGHDQEAIWHIRESGLGATAHVPGARDTWEGWEDAAVPPEKLGEYLRDFRKLLDRYEYHGSLYGHFGQGCVHTRIDFGLKTREGIAKFKEFVHAAAHLVTEYGGSLSGEHGDGQSRGRLLGIMYGEELVEGFREFKRIWDPEGKMNPGKVVDAYDVDENLRYGENYNPPEVATKFQYPQDQGSFAYAMERCVGVGKCRKTESGTMCPSYMVTKEEMHSTRGRARLLWEMLNGDAIGEKGWREESVKEALDLCLACKGCKAECPINVDMATYKAEFRYHYYKGRVRPRAAYAMGLIYWWARMASWAPGVANFFARTPPFRTVAKWMGGIAQERAMPRFAGTTFREWFQRRAARNLDGPVVLLWPDTFTNFFEPGIGRAAVRVLEGAGYQVRLPERMLCCGRPLYDFGMLDRARGLLREIVRSLAPQIQAGVQVVGLEPSCTAVFRDELVEMLPNDVNARRLHDQTFTLAEFLIKKGDGFEMPRLKRKAVVHGHCHQHAIMKLTSEEELYEKMGLDYELLDSGCCGMAGSFGFEAENYEVSVQCGERVLLPKVRETPEEVLIIADGFSCRTQMGHLAKRRAWHTAEVLEMAMREGEPGEQWEEEMTIPARKVAPVAFAAAGAMLAGIAAYHLLKRRR